MIKILKIPTLLIASFTLAFLMLLMIGPSYSYGAVNPNVCPEGDGWEKVDDLTSTSYTYPGIDGKLVAEVCYKAGNDGERYSVNPPTKSVTVTSTIWNKDGCPGIDGCNIQDLSHATFRLIDDDLPVVKPFVRVTYICMAQEDGVVEGYDLPVLAGDHIWRIRHESGPATDFSTNFLSEVYGNIGVGETLFFVTQQNANGVKVVTTPLANEYRGTASVSGKICTLKEEEEPKYCIETITVEGEWTTEYVVNPEDPTEECIQRTNLFYDAEDKEYDCGEEIEYSCRPIEVTEEDDDPGTGDILGEKTEREVTTQVLGAKTGANDNIFVYAAQILLTVLTVVSSVILVKPYIK